MELQESLLMKGIIDHLIVDRMGWCISINYLINTFDRKIGQMNNSYDVSKINPV